MFVWKTWAKVKMIAGKETRRKEYGVLLLFGIIHLFIRINVVR